MRAVRFHAGLALACMAAATTVACAGTDTMSDSSPAQAPLQYPLSRRGEDVDHYHGVAVADPYRWMEQLASPEVRAWVAAENAVSRPYLESLPARPRLVERLTLLWNYDQYGLAALDDKHRVPISRAGRYFFVEKHGLQDQAVLYWSAGLHGQARVLVDPNQLSDDSTVALSDFSVSPDGRYVAYALSDGGTDWDVWHLREVESGRDLPERIEYTKFTHVSWTPDGLAFYYSRYPAKPDGQGDDQQQVRVYRHALGTPQEADTPVFAIDDHPRRNPYATVTDDGRWLVYTLFDENWANAVYLQDLATEDAPVLRWLDAWDGRYELLGNDADLFYFKTTQGAPRGRVVAIHAGAPEPAAWRVLIPEQPERLRSASLVGCHIVASYLRDAHALVRIHRMDGSLRNELKLPGAGTVVGFPDSPASSETFLAYTDYLTPTSLLRYDLATGAFSNYRSPATPFDGSSYLTEQIFYPSRDGTRVPMFITRRRDAKTDGRNPVLLYGYGGFDQSMTPAYSPAVAAWLESGGIYAVANLRGGGEYGEDWHQAGTRLVKQNVFDDFIAAAEWLVREGYTSPAKLGIMGRSNGGLLVGAVLAQRPGLFGAALPAVGVLDMLRYHTASANAYQWSSDYGTVEDPKEFTALRAYSPVHNLVDGGCYPPTLVTTADRDDRVVPWHSYKFAAALQHAQGCANPVLIRVETRAGHGAGKPTWMQVEDWADQLAFLARHLGM